MAFYKNGKKVKPGDPYTIPNTGLSPGTYPLPYGPNHGWEWRDEGENKREEINYERRVIMEKNIVQPTLKNRSTRHDYFIKRVTELGLLDPDSDYDGMLGRAIIELSETFAKQGHSGMSASIVIHVFNQLMEEYNEGGIV